MRLPSEHIGLTNTYNLKGYIKEIEYFIYSELTFRREILEYILYKKY